MLPKEYSNKHLLEVVCGFNFSPDGVKWDSAFFGQYYDKVQGLGFTERVEQKGIQVQLTDYPQEITKSPKISTRDVESKMIFKNPSNGFAITMGKDQISFHRVSQYTHWVDFMKLFITPCIEIYQSLGLYHEKKNCQVIYLNRFDFASDENLSDYFTFLNPIGKEFGYENSTIIQRTFNYKDIMLLVVKLNNFILADGKQQVTLESGAISIDQNLNEESSWDKLASTTHEPIRNFFESIITDKLRKQL